MRATYLTALLAGAAVLLASCASQEEIERSREPRTTVYVAPSPASSEATYYYGGSTSGANATSYYGSSPSWPRVSIAGNTTNLLYQPRVDYWDGHKLVARDAVELKSSNEPQSVFGVVTFQATTLVDKTARTVSLVNISVTGGDFPSQAQRSAELVNRARQAFPKELKGIPLDQLENSFVLPPQQVSAGGHSLNNTPPRIIISTKPALLIYVDGPPAFRQVTGTGLQRVINTRFLMWKDEAGTYYLRTADGYLQANGLQGPWKLCSNVPPGAAQVESDGLNAATPVDSSTWQAGGTTNRVASSESTDIYVSTSPAELILFQGTPDFVPVSGNSKLLYVANTSGNVFKLVSDQQNYVLLSGRWYRAPSLNGPWQYVSANQLPKDFAEIPDNSPKENVKASVPGTQQATEALIANSIPESTAVARNTTMVPPQFDGEPALKSIQGTPLRYVANSSTPIIEVDEHSWYACQNGVWFVSSSVNGPWSVATSVPTVIYTIPPDSPLHYVTYVQVYGASPQEVYEGYTPGYMGTEEQDGVVVYGTGYYYPAWVGGVWWAWPYTWCWGWGPCWTPWYGWGFNCGFGWYCGGWYSYGWGHCHPPAPCWGPYRGGTYHAQAVASSRTIGPATVASSRTLGSSTIASTRTIGTSTASSLYRRNDSSGRNIPYLGANSVQTASTVGRSYNSRTGALASGQYAGVQNVRSSFETRAPTAWNTGVGTARPAFSSRYAPSYNSQGRGNAYSGGYYHGSGAMPGARAGWGGGGAAPRGGGGAVHAGGGGGGSHGGFFGGGGGGGGGGHGGGGGGGGGGGHGSSGR